MNLAFLRPTLHPRAAALLFVLLGCGRLVAQDAEVNYFDNTYVDHIKTVRLHIDGFPHSYPLIELGGGGTAAALLR